MIWTNDRDCGVNPKKRWTNDRDCGVNPKKRKKKGRSQGFRTRLPHTKTAQKNTGSDSQPVFLYPFLSNIKSIALFFFLLSLPEQLPSSALKGLLFPLPLLESP